MAASVAFEFVVASLEAVVVVAVVVVEASVVEA